MRLLYVEDHAATAKVVESMLRNVGYDIDTADSGERAIEMASEREYDLVLLDIMLPDLTGLEVAKRLRESGKDLKVVFQTGLSEVREEVRKAGRAPGQFLFKPFNRSALIAEIERAAGNTMPEASRVEKRSAARSSVLRNVWVVSPYPFDCVMMNVSEGGAAIRPVHDEIKIPDEFVLAVRGKANRTCEVRWRRGAVTGLEFT